jgi:glycerol-3-phosphate dehydrogenase
MHGKQEGAVWIDQTMGVLKAEIEYLIHEEMACTLADVIFRRTGLGTAECPPKIILEKIAAVMAVFLHWDKEKEKKEIDNVLCRYSPLILSV